MLHTRRSRNLYNSSFHNQILEATQCYCVDKFISLILLILKLMLTKQYFYEKKIKHTRRKYFPKNYLTEDWCSSLNVNGPHKLSRNGTIGRYGFVGVGMALLEEVCYFEVCSSHTYYLRSLLLPAGCSSFLFSDPSPLPCLLACHHTMVIMD